MINWQKGRRLSEFSTFGIGGPISFFAAIQTSEDMEEAFHFIRAKGIPFFMLGRGSNCLFDDKGFAGAVLWNRIDFMRWEGRSVTAGGGAHFSLLGFKAASRGLTGLEFAAGIPASVGGAVFMNAGANGAETQESLREVAYLTSGGVRSILKKENMIFGYRSSPFQKMSGAILSASFELKTFPNARQKQLAILEDRTRSQPLKEKSAGCIFRNPAAGSAGAFIDRCGLKGLRVGGAAISKIHANFIVNQGGATAKDVLALIEMVQSKVFEQTKIHLELEIKIVNHDG